MCQAKKGHIQSEGEDATHFEHQHQGMLCDNFEHFQHKNHLTLSSLDKS